MAIKFVLKQLNGTPDEPFAEEYLFENNLFTIGSDVSNNLVLARSAPEQAVVIREGEQLRLINSAPGTRLNGKKLSREALELLGDGDEIEIDDYLIAVIDDDEAATVISGRTAPPNGDSDFSQFLETNAPNGNFAGLPDDAENRKVTPSDASAIAPPNFADILNTLRTEEDSFYFSLKKNDAEIGRIPLEQAEMLLGGDARGEIVSGAEIVAVYALVRKDWSGITIEPQDGARLTVNEEPLEAARRLRNEDRVGFPEAAEISLVLHEPSSLVALESLLATRRQPAEDVSANRTAATDALATKQVNAETRKTRKISFLKRRFFGYFNFSEIMTMFIGTLIGAVLVFLFLEFLFTT